MGTDIPFGDVSLCAWAFRERQILLRKLLSTIAQMKQSGYEDNKWLWLQNHLSQARHIPVLEHTQAAPLPKYPQFSSLIAQLYKKKNQNQAAFLMDAEWDGGPVSLSTSLTDLYSGKGGEGTFGQHLH